MWLNHVEAKVVAGWLFWNANVIHLSLEGHDTTVLGSRGNISQYVILDVSVLRPIHSNVPD